MTESEIRKEICEYLFTLIGCIFTVNAKSRGKFVSNRWPPKGWPDISGSLNGRGLFIEVKTPTGKVYQEQIEFRDRALAAGNIAFFATCVADVHEALKKWL